MKVKCSHSAGQKKLNQRGSATLVVLVFLTIMAVYIVGNNVILHNLNQELRLVEKRQLRKYRDVVVEKRVAKKERVDKAEVAKE